LNRYDFWITIQNALKQHYKQAKEITPKTWHTKLDQELEEMLEAVSRLEHFLQMFD